MVELHLAKVNVVGSNPIGRSSSPHPVPSGGVRSFLRGQTQVAKGKTIDGQPAVRVGTSTIHGRGLFAADDIPADTLILTIDGRPTDEDGEHVIWFHGDDGSLEGFEITNDARFVNHASEPNAIFVDDELWSLRTIPAGEEITHHYGEDWAHL